ncbi:MAG: ribosome biogenesis GTPase Der [Gammaproteobacteria bacterium]|nr:ribosome biogenesis GTPase Der [Gammaproteobacteria bacterium]
MLPVIAIVGRPNVGKSTLFNVLTRSRAALVADVPGLTRDRQYGYGQLGSLSTDDDEHGVSVAGRYVVIDTGGLSGEAVEVDRRLAEQTLLAIEEADHIIFMVDAKHGLVPQDHVITEQLRRHGKPITVAVNKSEGRAASDVAAEFFELGLGDPVPIAAKSKDRVKGMINKVLATHADQIVVDEIEPGVDSGIKIAAVGRPNVGKSTLINRWLGEERVVALDHPGTTRDSIYIPFEHHNRHYTLIDTAGVRRRARVDEGIEKFSVVKTLQAIDDANVVVLMLDASEGVTDQDASLAGLIVDKGRALVIAINKWDGLSTEQRDHVRRGMDLKLRFLDFAPKYFISALHGTAVGDVLDAVRLVYASAIKDLPTAAINEVLKQALEEHSPRRIRGRRPKLRYAHQGGKNPPRIIIHGSFTDRVRPTFKRYLVNRFRKRFDLVGTPISVEFRHE